MAGERVQPGGSENRKTPQKIEMNNRKLRNLRPGMSLATLRELALGEDLVKWSSETEPVLRKQCEDGLQQLSILISETQKDLLDLELGIEDGEDERQGEGRKSEITRLTIQLERQTGILKSQTEIYQKLSAGGGASVWAALQRLTPPQAPQREEERDAGPKRHFRSVKATEVEAQVVDSE